MNNGERSVAGVLTDTNLTTVLSTDGTVSGTDGCNHYSATYTLSGAWLSLMAMTNTRMMCARLELRRADGALSVSLTKH